MSNPLARMNGREAGGGGKVPENRAVPWTPLRDLLGFDPFQNIRASYGFDYDVSRTDAGYEVEVPVPGYSSSEIEVTFRDGILNVAGKSERRSFTRSFTIPEDVDPDSIEARVQDGMLVLGLRRLP